MGLFDAAVLATTVIGAGDLALSCFGAELFWRRAVLALGGLGLGCFGTSAYLLDCYYQGCSTKKEVWECRLHTK